MVVPRLSHSACICPPIGLAYIAAAIQKADLDVRCVDALGEAPFQRIVLENPNFLTFGLSAPEIVERVGKCDVIGITLMFSQDWPVARSIIRDLRQTYPQATIVGGGEHISACPEFCLEDCPEMDICVLGEGEETIVELLEALEENRSLENVSGIVYRSREGPVRTPPRSRITELEEIAWPAWDLFPLENYLANGLGYGVAPGRTVPLILSRGCPYECTFCSNPQMWTTRWKARATDDVINEMQCYIDHYGAENFDFYDLTTIVRKDWIVEFCEKVIERQWKISWQMPSGTRSEALDHEVLHLMALSNQRNLCYAPESGSPTTLKKIKKKVNLDRMKESIRAALKEGMNVKLNMIMGFPHETDKELLETWGFLKEMALMGVHDVYIACFSPYPGSELFNQLYEAGQIKEMNDDYFFKLTSFSDISYSHSYSPHLSHRRLTFYRLGGMLLFYTLSYLIRPTRLFRTLWNLLRGREESRGEMTLRQMIDRFLRKKTLLKDVNVGALDATSYAQSRATTMARVP